MEEENDVIKDRLIHFLTVEKMTAMKFAEIMEIQPSNISHFMKGRNKPNFDFISRFFLRFPEISPDWFINGKGNMYREGKQLDSSTQHETPNEIPTDLFSYDDNNVETVPVIQTTDNKESDYPILEDQSIEPQRELDIRDINSNPATTIASSLPITEPALGIETQSVPLPGSSFEITNENTEGPDQQAAKQQPVAESVPSIDQQAAKQQPVAESVPSIDQQAAKQQPVAESVPSIDQRPGQVNQPISESASNHQTEKVDVQSESITESELTDKPQKENHIEASQSMTKHKTGIDNESTKTDAELCQSMTERSLQTKIPKVVKIVMFYDDMTFVEYSSK